MDYRRVYLPVCLKPPIDFLCEESKCSFKTTVNKEKIETLSYLVAKLGKWGLLLLLLLLQRLGKISVRIVNLQFLIWGQILSQFNQHFMRTYFQNFGAKNYKVVFWVLNFVAPKYRWKNVLKMLMKLTLYKKTLVRY